MFAVVNFDALAQASNIRIERRQVVFCGWMQDSNPRSQTPIRQQSECLLTNRLSYQGSSLKTWTRQPIPMITKHSAHLTSLTNWLSHLALAIYMFVVVNFDALAQSSDFRTQRVSETQSPGNWMPTDKPTELSRIKLKNLNSTSRPYDQQAFSPPDPPAIWRLHLALAIYIFVVYTYLLSLISMLWHRQAIFESKGDKLSSYAECKIRTQRVSETQSPADWMPADKLTELSRIKLKTWTRQPVPMISEHSAHLTPQPFGIRTWLWRYTCMLLFISLLWHRQAIFKWKGDKLSSSAECRIRTHQGIRHQIASRLNAPWQTDWAVNDQAKNLNSKARPYDRQAFSPLNPTAIWHSHLALAICMFVVALAICMFVVANFNALAQASDIRI